MAIRPLPIARPCSAAFGAMRGNDQTRFCDSCGKNVHDLSSRTEAEARALLTEARGTRICVRYAKDAHGSIRFRAAVTMAAAVSLAACGVATGPATNAPAPTTNAPATNAIDDGEGDRDMGDVIVDADDLCPDDPGPNDDGCPERP